jgi:AcrR family transcriptional regulator
MNNYSYNAILSIAMKQRARSQKEKQIRRHNLLDSAKILFSKKGYAGTTVGMIAASAGVSTGTFYLYFKSKTEVFRILNIEGLDILHKMMADAISWPADSFFARMSLLVQTYYRFYTDYRGYYELMSLRHLSDSDFSKNRELLPVVEEKTRRLLKQIEFVVMQGVERNEIECSDTWKTTTAIWSFMDGIFQLKERNILEIVELSLDDLIKHSVEVVFYGLVKN